MGIKKSLLCHVPMRPTFSSEYERGGAHFVRLCTWRVVGVGTNICVTDVMLSTMDFKSSHK